MSTIDIENESTHKSGTKSTTSTETSKTKSKSVFVQGHAKKVPEGHIRYDTLGKSLLRGMRRFFLFCFEKETNVQLFPRKINTKTVRTAIEKWVEDRYSHICDPEERKTFVAVVKAIVLKNTSYDPEIQEILELYNASCRAYSTKN